jgi:hypothetical protein
MVDAALAVAVVDTGFARFDIVYGQPRGAYIWDLYPRVREGYMDNASIVPLK